MCKLQTSASFSSGTGSWGSCKQKCRGQSIGSFLLGRLNWEVFCGPSHKNDTHLSQNGHVAGSDYS